MRGIDRIDLVSGYYLVTYSDFTMYFPTVGKRKLFKSHRMMGLWIARFLHGEVDDEVRM